MAGAAALFGYGAVFVRRRARKLPMEKNSRGLATALVCVALLPLGWYLFTANHTYNHAFFTSRALCVTVFGLTGALTCCLPARKKK